MGQATPNSVIPYIRYVRTICLRRHGAVPYEIISIGSAWGWGIVVARNNQSKVLALIFVPEGMTEEVTVI
jgi:hypothetical protein